MNDTLKGCLMLVFIVVAATVATLMNGWALSVLWGWFIVPLFALPALPILYAIGISFIASLLYRNVLNTEKKKGEDTSTLIGKMIGQIIGIPLFAVFLGWIVHSLIH